MTILKEFPILFFLIILFGCNSQIKNQKLKTSEKINACNPYYTYDNVEHYYFDITENEIWKIDDKARKTSIETKQLELLIQDTPDKFSDTTILKNIDKIGFVKNRLSNNKFEKLDFIFCEKKHKQPIAMSCIAIYRDILVFKNNDKIVGTAKICFECGQCVITGTTRNTSEFGQSGDYEKLYELLH